MPLERLRLGLTLGMLLAPEKTVDADVDSVPLEVLESAESLILGDTASITPLLPPPPRIVLTSKVATPGAFTASRRELDPEAGSLGVVVPFRPPDGLGIFDPGALEAIGEATMLVLDVVDMYIGGSIVGAGLAFGGSMADSV